MISHFEMCKIYYKGTKTIFLYIDLTGVTNCIYHCLLINKKKYLRVFVSSHYIISRYTVYKSRISTLF